MSPPFLCADWPAPPGINALTTLRYGIGASSAPFDQFNLGSRCGDEAGAVIANRAALESALALPAAPCWLQQVHGIGVARLGVPTLGDEPEADASVTSEAGVVLAILTADCLPVLFCSDDGQELAAAHAGWRGLAAGVLETTVAAMRCSPQKIMAWLGPAAGPQAYEIGAEVRSAFLDHDSGAANAFTPTREQHWRVDLYALARQRLAAAGVTRIYGGGLCTISDPTRFFSHRRDARTGRIASLIWRNRS